MKLLQAVKNMKYRHKLTILLVVASLVPMTVLALYSHNRTVYSGAGKREY